jgi:hypothetical protein
MYQATNVNEDSKGLEKDRKRVIQIMRSASDRTLSTWACVSPSKINFYVDYACHAPLMEGRDGVPKDLTLFASCFDTRYTDDQHRESLGGEIEEGQDEKYAKETAERYWSWMTGSDSPWKLLFEKSFPGRIEDENGYLVGFFLDPTAVLEKSRLAYNFMIAMRMVGEERTSIKTWAKLVDTGMRESDALYLSRIIRPKEDGYVAYSNNDASHWPLLNEAYDYYCGSIRYLGSFNFKKFRDGDFDFDQRPETKGWVTAPYRKDFSLGSIKEFEAIPGGRKFKLEDVIAEYSKWVDEQDYQMRKEAA